MDSKPKLVIFGTGNTAELASVYLQAYSSYEVVAYTGDRRYLKEPLFLGKPVLAWDELPAHYPPSEVMLMGPLSVRRMNRIRKERFAEAKALGYGFASFVHPSVECLEVKIGENCFVFGQCVIEPFARLGDNVIVWSKAHIGHHTVIEDHCFIGPGAGIGGNCTIGESTFFGPKADVVPGVRIGRACLVAQRAVVNKDAPDHSVFIPEYTAKSDLDSRRLERLI